ncbi:uncharacterized protein F4822DRAFT_152850 [Hypoxylon trugodes]|uniref:uncharacterized protein n=1 Tax=Hypoxylon trugodes TaxID=326681 RepID=UPI0021A093D1|nr:uncharacterized protein F4822DRAFT_152850 [Hypoxylon trugodes]KAI1390508.1 hypothetical protein F4822DRAFT_152850 [Hypoxylon trugodes]
MLRLTLSALGLLAVQAAAQCTRESLIAATDSLLAAQTEGKPDGISPLAESVTYLEAFKTADIKTGILSHPLKIDFNRSLHDTVQCATYTEIVVTDKTHPYVIGTQLRFADGKIANISSLVTDQGDWLFNATGTYYWASREKWDPIPEDQRDSREVIQAAADAYADLFNDKTVQVPWGTPCARLEGGSYTGTGSATDSCNVGVPSGVKLSNRRYVIDETLGAVDVFIDFATVPDSHEFRVEKGKLRYVHTITVMG